MCFEIPATVFCAGRILLFETQGEMRLSLAITKRCLLLLQAALSFKQVYPVRKGPKGLKRLAYGNVSRKNEKVGYFSL